MTVILPEEVSLSLLRNGLHEFGLTRILLKYLRKGMIFFDIGAHFGYFTLLGSMIVGDKGQVHSFEPTPNTFRILQSNAKDKKNIFVNRMAVFSKRGTFILNTYGSRYSAFNSLYDPKLTMLQNKNSVKYRIPTISLDEYIYQRGIRPDFIKIDAENAEFEILLGMKRILSDIRPIISIEVGDFDIKDVTSSKDIISYLIEQGYEPYEYSNGKILKHELKNRYQYDNILFLPSTSESK